MLTALAAQATVQRILTPAQCRTYDMGPVSRTECDQTQLQRPPDPHTSASYKALRASGHRRRERSDGADARQDARLQRRLRDRASGLRATPRTQHPNLTDPNPNHTTTTLTNRLGGLRARVQRPRTLRYGPAAAEAHHGRSTRAGAALHAATRRPRRATASVRDGMLGAQQVESAPV